MLPKNIAGLISKTPTVKSAKILIITSAKNGPQGKKSANRQTCKVGEGEGLISNLSNI